MIRTAELVALGVGLAAVACVLGGLAALAVIEVDDGRHDVFGTDTTPRRVPVTGPA